MVFFDSRNVKEATMSEIQIVYRQNSKENHASRLHQALSDYFVSDNIREPVALDPNAGAAAIEELRFNLAGCELLVVLVDEAWLHQLHEKRRFKSFNRSSDLIQFLHTVALQSNIPMVAVLTDNAEIPHHNAPAEILRLIISSQPVCLHSARWDRDIAQLIRRLEGLIVTQVEETQAIPAPPPESKARPGRLDRLKGVFSRWFRYHGSEPLPAAKKTEPPPLYERGGSELHAEAAEPQDVYLGASAPAALRPGDEFTARFVAYIEHEKATVEDILHRLSPRSTSALDIKHCRWQPGTSVTVSLTGRWLEVEEAEQTFIWDAAYVVLDFDVMLASDAPWGATVLKFDVAIDGIRVAKLRIDLQVVDTRESHQSKTVVTGAARTAFASYSSQDRQRVLDRLASVRISAGLDVFLDCLSLRPGERWKLKITEEIRSRDQFLLFWSKAAAGSKWVTWEWQTALNEKGIEDMQIHPLENNVAPPAELTDLHFSDVFVTIRGADS